MFLYFIFTLPSCLAKNSATLVVGRMLAGLSASAPMCNIGGRFVTYHIHFLLLLLIDRLLVLRTCGQLRNVVFPWPCSLRHYCKFDQAISFPSFSDFFCSVGPCLGPMIGGWIGMKAGWRWMCKFIFRSSYTYLHRLNSLYSIDWVLFIFLGVAFALTLFIPETLAPVILRRKAERLRKETGDESYRTLEELEKLPFKETLKISMVRPFLMLFQEPIIIFMTCYLSFVYSLLCMSSFSH